MYLSFFFPPASNDFPLIFLKYKYMELAPIQMIDATL